jgi:hypothetical protein
MAADPELTAETRAWLRKSAKSVLDPTFLEIVKRSAYSSQRDCESSPPDVRHQDLMA